MGSNKALLRLHAGGPTLVESVVANLRAAGLEPGLLVANTPEEYDFVGLPTVRDVIEGVGPLGGILTALEYAEQPRIIVVACDMPALNPALIRYMVGLPDTYDAIVPRWTTGDGTERIETLHAIYSRHCIEPLRRSIREGKLKANRFLAQVRTLYLGDELRRFDPDLSCFRNINTPEEWAALSAPAGKADASRVGSAGVAAREDQAGEQ